MSGEPPAGWYPDTITPGRQRWWDGLAWTDHYHPPQESIAPTPPQGTQAWDALPTRARPPQMRLIVGISVAAAVVIVGGSIALVVAVQRSAQDREHAQLVASVCAAWSNDPGIFEDAAGAHDSTNAFVERTLSEQTISTVDQDSIASSLESIAARVDQLQSSVEADDISFWSTLPAVHDLMTDEANWVRGIAPGDQLLDVSRGWIIVQDSSPISPSSLTGLGDQARNLCETGVETGSE